MVTQDCQEMGWPNLGGLTQGKSGACHCWSLDVELDLKGDLGAQGSFGETSPGRKSAE